ncbi:MAG: superoxide dismutase family protein [Bacteroidetes bacterium]|nr:superoxide dismutase family protein [Bacteroidota bacterium]
MKKNISTIFAIITSAILIMLTYYATAQDHKMHKQLQSINTAICVLGPTEGSGVSGTITFTRTMQGIKVVAELNGLSVGAHGFHIHEFGDCSAADGTSAGGHFNPEGHEHAGLDAEMNHVGDLGNLVADQNGHAHLEFTTNQIQFEGTNSIIGRSIIVHAQADDLKSQPTGNAGARVACGTIGITK